MPRKLTPLLFAAACSSAASPAPATPEPAPQPATVESAAEDAPASPEAHEHEYRWEVGDSAVLVVSQTSVANTTVDGAVLPVVNATYELVIVAEVVDTDEDEYIVQYEIHDATLSVPWVTPDEARRYVDAVRGLSHRRGVTVRGDSLAMDAIDPQSTQGFLVEISEALQVPLLPKGELVAGRAWPSCMVEFLKKDTDGVEESTCTIESIDADAMTLRIEGTERGDMDPPRIDGYTDNDIIVDVSNEVASCTYRLAFESPGPVSATCTGTTHQTGRAGGKPFVYQATHERTIRRR